MGCNGWGTPVRTLGRFNVIRLSVGYTVEDSADGFYHGHFDSIADAETKVEALSAQLEAERSAA